jgi:hypothetical protein
MEEHAFSVLFGFYQEISGRYRHDPAAIEMICRDLQVSLRASISDPLQALIVYPRNEIIIPEQSESIVRTFLVSHELAHWQLWKKIEFFRRNRITNSLPIDEKEEYWCDAFGIAMLFAWVGKNVILARNYNQFFARGTEDVEHSCYKHALRHIRCGERIHSLNQELFHPPLEDMGKLGDNLLINGAKHLLKEEPVRFSY